jgi:hypothetical protein
LPGALKKIAMPGGRDSRGRHGTARLALLHLAVNRAGKHSGNIAYLQACQQHSAFAHRTENTSVMKDGIGKRRNNSHNAGRDENPNPKKPAQHCPQKDAPNDKDGHETSPPNRGLKVPL